MPRTRISLALPPDSRFVGGPGHSRLPGRLAGRLPKCIHPLLRGLSDRSLLNHHRSYIRFTFVVRYAVVSAGNVSGVIGEHVRPIEDR